MATDTGKSALGGIDGNVAAAIGYPIGIIAIICLIIDKENRFVKFHAVQSLLLHVAFIVVWIALIILFMIFGIIFGVAASAAGGSAGGGLASLFGLLSFVIWIVFIVAYIGGLIMAAVKAYGGNMFRLPIIGNMAAKWSGN
ncbi:MAG TPA: hypothetical protein VE863_20340 [Pyrinomonadaceae bacterium]|jgi:uncharacterized membrane protein|nr:hypothetical protein [Pyrinomonadaceae bacterium]